MKLSVSDRIRLLGVLPDKGNILTIKIVQTLRGDLSFSEKELKDWEITSDVGMIKWNDKVKEKKVEVGDAAKAVIVDSLKALDEKSELSPGDIGLWDKFVGEG
jgi:KaiC/GvpD/RAD55 family RecA-like ATPase